MKKGKEIFKQTKEAERVSLRSVVGAVVAATDETLLEDTKSELTSSSSLTSLIDRASAQNRKVNELRKAFNEVGRMEPPVEIRMDFLRKALADISPKEAAKRIPARGETIESEAPEGGWKRENIEWDSVDNQTQGFIIFKGKRAPINKTDDLFYFHKLVVASSSNSLKSGGKDKLATVSAKDLAKEWAMQTGQPILESKELLIRAASVRGHLYTLGRHLKQQIGLSVEGERGSGLYLKFSGSEYPEIVPRPENRLKNTPS